MYFKDLNRFNYWDRPAINPLLWTAVTGDIEILAHEEHSADCYRLHVAGDLDVIFEYVGNDVSAFDEPWVAVTMKRWRIEGTPESHNKLKQLIGACTDNRGHTPLQETVRLILRDQAIFKKIVTLRNEPPKPPLRNSGNRDGAYALVGKIYNLGEETIEDIYKIYKDKADVLMGKKSPRLLSPHLLPKKHNEALQDAFKSLGVDQYIRTPGTPLLSSWDDVCQWLDDMAAQLRWLAGS